MAVLSLVCALAVAGFATQGQAVAQTYNLGDLITSQETVQNGDKLFADWYFDSAVFSASDVQVKLIQDQFGYGLSFGGPWYVIGNSAADFRLEFSVEVAPEASGNLISDVHLNINEANAVGGGYVSVSEQVHSNGPVPLIQPPLHVLFADTTNPPDSLSDSWDLPTPQKRLYIRKDVMLVAGNGTEVLTSRAQLLNYTNLSYLDQTFSQIPEPGTVLLVATGIFGLCLTGRRSRK